MRIIPKGDRELEGQWRVFEKGYRTFRKGQQHLQEKLSEKSRSKALEVMPEEVKVLYVKTLVAQSLVDGETDPKKVADVYLFMSRIDLQAEARTEIRQFLDTEESTPPKVVELASKTVVRSRDSRDEIAFSLIKDMVRVSRAGGGPSQAERESIGEVALEFGYDAEEAISLAKKAIEYDEALVNGEVDIGELQKRGKDLAAKAASVGVPIAAIYVSGSVVGLSAAGITSGLAWLGLGGVLGLSSMVTGIGTVILLGAATYAGARWAMGGKERELKRQREHMVKEVIERHQKAIVDLSDDINTIAAKMEKYTAQSDRNEERVSQLEGELRTFRSALAALKHGKRQYAG